MSNHHSSDSYCSSTIFTPIPLKLSNNGSRSSDPTLNSNRSKASKRTYTPTHSPSPIRKNYSRFYRSTEERPENPMIKDQKFMELQNVISPFDSQSLLPELIE